MIGMIIALASGVLLQQWVTHDLGGIAEVSLPAEVADSAPPYKAGWLDKEVRCRAGLIETPALTDDAALYGYLKDLKATLPESKTVFEQDILVDGWRGIDFMITMKGGALQVRAVAIGRSGTAAVEMLSYVGRPVPKPTQVSSFTKALRIKKTNPNPFKNPGPQWIPYEGLGYRALHTADRIRDESQEMAYSVYADRMYFTGNFPIASPVKTEKELERFADATGMGFLLSLSSRVPSLRFLKSPDPVLFFGPPMKVVYEADSSEGIHVRMVLNPIGDRVFIRCYAGPRSIAYSESTQRWFNAFKIN